VHAAVRRVVPMLTNDRSSSRDIEAIAALIGSGGLEYAAGLVVN
jgi:histidine ammonia-lyase